MVSHVALTGRSPSNAVSHSATTRPYAGNQTSYSLSESGPEGHWLDGCLTLYDFRRLIIECIIEHNMAHRLRDDDLSGDLNMHSVEPYPRDVWTWGLQSRSGGLRRLPTDDLRRVLFPHAKATATPEGIYFRGMLYTCDAAIQERWFDTAHSGAEERQSIPIIYDPRTAGSIFLCTPEGLPLEVCRLFEKDEKTFEGCDWFDIEDLLTRYRNKRDAETQRLQMFEEHCAMRDRLIEGGKFVS